MIFQPVFLSFVWTKLVSSKPQNAPQFIPGSVAAITLEAANLAAKKGGVELLAAADEGTIPFGINQIDQVKSIISSVFSNYV